jgi:hypothetical protein
MKKFSELDHDKFVAGFNSACTAGANSSGESELAGYAFAMRLFRSVQSDWEPGRVCDMAKAREQLNCVIRGELTLLPPAADVKSQLDAAYKELTAGLPEELVATIAKATASERMKNEKLAETASLDRKEKDQFDRDAAKYLASRI